MAIYDGIRAMDVIIGWIGRRYGCRIRYRVGCRTGCDMSNEDIAILEGDIVTSMALEYL